MIPDNLRYTKDHEWAKKEGDCITTGITQYAQDSLGDVVFLELPNVGKKIDAHGTFGVVESIKAVSDLYAPIAGEIVEVHSDLVADPGRINKSPYQEWLVKIRPANMADFDKLLSPADYKKHCGG